MNQIVFISLILRMGWWSTGRQNDKNKIDHLVVDVLEYITIKSIVLRLNVWPLNCHYLSVTSMFPFPNFLSILMISEKYM